MSEIRPGDIYGNLLTGDLLLVISRYEPDYFWDKMWSTLSVNEFGRSSNKVLSERFLTEKCERIT
jgi:hypothetical protein